MSHKKYKQWQSVSTKLRKIGEEYLGNQVVAKVKKNPEPEHKYDYYRMNIRVVIEHKVGRHKSMPTLNVYGANDLDLETLEESLRSTIISIQNARQKLADVNEMEQKRIDFSNNEDEDPFY